MNLHSPRTIVITLTLVVMLTGAGCNSQPPRPLREVFLVLADNSPPSAAVGLQDMVGDLPPGSIIHLLAASQQKPVGKVVVPDGTRTSRLRKPAVRSALLTVKSHFEAPEAASQQVHLPGLGGLIRGLRQTDYPCHVILAGTPVYQDARHSGFDMTRNVVPSDSALESPDSPFANGVEKFPPGTTVTWLYSPVANIDFAHRSRLKRFYKGFCQVNDAKLARFTPDADTAFAMSHPAVQPVELELDAPLAMVKVSNASTQADVDDDTILIGAKQRDSDLKTFLDDAVESSDKFVVAIEWFSEDREADIDCHFRCRGFDKELSYRYKKTPFGELNQDVVSTRGGSSSDYYAWETVTFDDPGRINGLEFWLHTFNASKPCEVKIICVWRDKIMELVVEMPATGVLDPAQGRDNRADWKKIEFNNQWRQVNAESLHDTSVFDGQEATADTQVTSGENPGGSANGPDNDNTATTPSVWKAWFLWFIAHTPHSHMWLGYVLSFFLAVAAITMIWQCFRESRIPVGFPVVLLCLLSITLAAFGFFNFIAPFVLCGIASLFIKRSWSLNW